MHPNGHAYEPGDLFLSREVGLKRRAAIIGAATASARAYNEY